MNDTAKPDRPRETAELPTRTPLEMAMWAAWLGVDPERVPECYKAHTCADTMARWKKVGEAAVAFLANADRERGTLKGMYLHEMDRATAAEAEIQAAKLVIDTHMKRAEAAEAIGRQKATAEIVAWFIREGMPGNASKIERGDHIPTGEADG